MELMRKPQAVLGIAIFCALLAAFFGYIYQSNQASSSSRRAAGRAVSKVAVLVADRELRAGVVIEPDSVVVREVEESVLPPSPLRVPAQAVGRVVSRTMAPGDVFTQDAVVDASIALGPSYVLSSNLRAVTVMADMVSGIAGFLKPGDRVDVMATFNRNEESVTRMILQDVEVLAVSIKTEPTTPGETTARKTAGSGDSGVPVTLAVSVTEAEKLVLSDTEAKIRLALRPAAGGDFEASRGARLTAVSGIAKPKTGSESAAASASPPSRPAAGMTVSASGIPLDAAFGRSPISPMPPSGVKPKTAPAASKAERPVTVIRGTQVETVTVPVGAASAPEIHPSDVVSSEPRPPAF